MHTWYTDAAACPTECLMLWLVGLRIKGEEDNTKRQKCARLDSRSSTFFEPPALQTSHEIGNDVF